MQQHEIRQYYLQQLSVPIWLEKKAFEIVEPPKLAPVCFQQGDMQTKLTFIYIDEHIQLPQLMSFLKQVGQFYAFNESQICYAIYQLQVDQQLDFNLLPNQGQAVLLYSPQISIDLEKLKGGFNGLVELKLPCTTQNRAASFNCVEIKKALMGIGKIL